MVHDLDLTQQASPGVFYREYPPSSPLAPFVACFWHWQQSSGNEPSPFRVLPDGCLDFIFETGTGVQIVGLMKTAMVVKQPTRAVHFGIRFRPGRARPFLGHPVSLFTGRVFDLEEVIPKTRFQAEAVLEAEGLNRKIALVEKMLLDHLVDLQPSADFVDAALNNLEVPVDRLARNLGVNRRTLERQFAAHVGLSPKHFGRLRRFRYALRLLTESATSNLADLSLASGYYDQPHFNREFRQFVGLSPSAFLAERRGVAFVQDPLELRR